MHELLTLTKQLMNVDVDDLANDVILSEYLYAVEEFLAKQYRVFIRKTEVTYITNGNANTMLYTPYGKINTIIEVYIDDVLSTDTYTNRGNILFSTGTFSSGINNVSVKLDVGFDILTDIATIPSDLKMAIARFAMYLYMVTSKQLDVNITTRNSLGEMVSTKRNISSVPLEIDTVFKSYVEYVL